jgi:hypothetical protein
MYALGALLAQQHPLDTLLKSRPTDELTYNVKNVVLTPLVVLRRNTYLILFYNERNEDDEGTTNTPSWLHELVGP